MKKCYKNVGQLLVINDPFIIYLIIPRRIFSTAIKDGKSSSNSLVWEFYFYCTTR